MAAQEIKNQVCMTRMLAPGFSDLAWQSGRFVPGRPPAHARGAVVSDSRGAKLRHPRATTQPSVR
jgi:hypothetical protein